MLHIKEFVRYIGTQVLSILSCFHNIILHGTNRQTACKLRKKLFAKSYRSNEKFSCVINVDIVLRRSLKPAGEAFLPAVLVQLCRIRRDTFLGLVALVPPEKPPTSRPVNRYRKKEKGRDREFAIRHATEGASDYETPCRCR